MSKRNKGDDKKYRQKNRVKIKDQVEIDTGERQHHRHSDEREHLKFVAAGKAELTVQAPAAGNEQEAENVLAKKIEAVERSGVPVERLCQTQANQGR